MSYSNQAQWSNSNDTHKWFSHIKDTNGAIIRVEIYASNSYEASELLKTIYGPQLLSEVAARC